MKERLLANLFFFLGALLAGLLAIKAVVLFPLAYLFGISKNRALAVALVLAQSGEFALVLFSLANDAALIDDTVFQTLLMLVLLSMLVTPPASEPSRFEPKARSLRSVAAQAVTKMSPEKKTGRARNPPAMRTRGTRGSAASTAVGTTARARTLATRPQAGQPVTDTRTRLATRLARRIIAKIAPTM